MPQANGGYNMSGPSHRKRLTPDQVQQHKLLGQQLQRANAIAAQGLIRLDRLSPAQKQDEHVCSDLAGVASSISLLTACCERIVANSCEQKYSRISVRFTDVCEYCMAHRKLGDWPGTLEPDPAWEIQVETLLSLTTLAVYRVLGRACYSPGEMNKLPRYLADLSKALSRQQRHLDWIGSWQVTEIKVIDDFDSEFCGKCGHPFGPVPDQLPGLSALGSP